MQHDEKPTSADANEAQKSPLAAADVVPGPGASGAGVAQGAAAAQPATAAGDVATLSAEVEKLKGQIGDLTDRLLRAHAEMDNIRKRAEREKTDMAKYAITKFANDVVNVADNFDRAIQSVPANAAAETPALKSLLDGVTMTEREFINVLERHGVKRLDPKGEAFNPHQHQAVMEMQNADVPSGTVLQVYQCGYTIEDRILRPAMVVVAKGGQKPVKTPESPVQPQDQPVNAEQAVGNTQQEGATNGSADAQPEPGSAAS